MERRRDSRFGVVGTGFAPTSRFIARLPGSVSGTQALPVVKDVTPAIDPVLGVDGHLDRPAAAQKSRMLASEGELGQWRSGGCRPEQGLGSPI
jgi:hypothetical protein